MGTYKVVQNFVAYDSNHVERLAGGNRVDDNVAMNPDKVLRVQNAVFILLTKLIDLNI